MADATIDPIGGYAVLNIHHVDVSDRKVVLKFLYDMRQMANGLQIGGRYSGWWTLVVSSIGGIRVKIDQCNNVFVGG